MYNSDQPKQYDYSDGYSEQVEGYSEKMKPFTPAMHTCPYMHICPMRHTCPIATEYERITSNQSLEEDDLDNDRQYYGYTDEYSPKHPSHHYHHQPYYHQPYYYNPYPSYFYPPFFPYYQHKKHKKHRIEP
ncbi:hypothetical protein CPJCM30710_30710 [Clostridium polyendosporum]|uniref:Uncharacterized protein n=1 Tax=Clostridium polyendosporum TaxID=69208 RepID=A0A919VHH7_9CLOT|nr:hypothetical protein [Clostridium polyendosporum]GIM30405.1 hypothetical protein CPJCM30710_30710 [Clostridium polyendosporum]